MAKCKCKMVDCEHSATTEGYCRLHYLMVWKDGQSKEISVKKKTNRKSLESFAKKMLEKYPREYIDEALANGYDMEELSKFAYNEELDSIFDQFKVDEDDVVQFQRLNE